MNSPLYICLFIHYAHLSTFSLNQMADKGVVSRFRGKEMHCDECIRVTIGTPEENGKFLEMLKSVYEEITK
jgi:histidinol-phosphate/aromatic aminotransferase/cobyric acid decarboxylase-like protein